jgi:hypothetical protein
MSQELREEVGGHLSTTTASTASSDATRDGSSGSGFGSPMSFRLDWCGFRFIF